MAELQLDPQKTALVLIDLQNAVLGMTPAPHSADKVVENSVKLANAFRAKGAPVVYVRVDLNDFLKLPVDQPHNMGDKPLPAVASEIAASAGFQPGDILITKRHWGAFAGTDLEQQLKNRGHRHGRLDRHFYQPRRRIHCAAGHRTGICLCTGRRRLLRPGRRTTPLRV